MITEIEIEGFKSLEKVRLKLGALNLFIGANASGKSNVFDALRVLQGIGYGFTVGEIFDGKPKGPINEVWAGIRGGIARARFVGLPSRDEEDDTLVFRASMQAPHGRHTFSYSICISTDYGTIESESLKCDSKTVFEATRETTQFSDIWQLRERGQRGLPALPALHAHDYLMLLESDEEEERKACVRLLSNMQMISPLTENLRDYGQPLLAKRMGELGENFASLVKSILKSPKTREAYLAWLRQLTPVELDEVVTLEGAVGDPLFALKEGGRVFPAHVLSDGTLRFAALTAAFFQSDMPDILTIEEIENGIHPSRLRLLVELLKSQSGVDGPQVFATTHSPVVLAWLQESDYETTFFCKRDEETGASIIKPLSEVPRLIELVKKYSLGDLFTEGWMETAL